MRTGRDPVLQTLREAWLPVVIRYPASFHQFLVNVGLNITRAHPEAIPDAFSVNHHSQALQLVNHKIRDPALGTQDDMIATIITFVSYSVCILRLWEQCILKLIWK